MRRCGSQRIGGGEGWFEKYVNEMALQVSPVQVVKGVGNGTVAVDLDMEALNERGIIIDSRTTSLLLPSVARKPFQRVFDALNGKVLKEEYPKSALGGIDVDDVLPTIMRWLHAWREIPYLVSGELVVLEIEPRNYLRYDATYPPIIIKIKYHINILFTI